MSRKVGNNLLSDLCCSVCQKKLGVSVNNDNLGVFVCENCEKWICARCGMPIRKGILFVERSDGLFSHFSCVTIVLSNAVEDHPMGMGE